jgi:hypothetical protein
MEYTVISNTQVCGKVKDEKLTEDDIIKAGGSVEHLLASGHIKTANAVKLTPVVKEVPAPEQETEFPVFNSVNNEQGEE